MAKLGIEVEGILRGQNVKTYFCSAEEYIENEEILEELFDYGVEMIYISDHHNELDLDALSLHFEGTGIAVTVELTELNDYPPPGVQIFWNVAQASYAQARTIKFLRHGDQIKIEHEKTVVSFETSQAIVTSPEDFEGDVEV